MVYESSYESGRKPFLPDPTRGTWSSPNDFIYACLGLAFKNDILSLSWLVFFDMGVYAIIPYLIFLTICTVPIMVIQFFVGQFSSSAFISSLRISPLFKGMGFIGLALDFSILTYYTVFTSVPLLYLINSFRPTLPWSCEGLKSWSSNVLGENVVHLCNSTAMNDTEVEMELDDALNITSVEKYVRYHLPSVLYFSSHFSNEVIAFENIEDQDLSISWMMVFCTLLTWGIVAGIFYKFFNIEQFGKLLRYGVWITTGLIIICLVRFAFLPGGVKALKQYFMPRLRDIEYGIPNIPLFATLAFGTGWGTLISLSSLNKFKTDIMRNSWIICLGQMLIFLALGMTTMFVDTHFRETVSSNYYQYVEHHWILYLSSGSALASMRFANFWSILFYLMLFMSALITMCIQIYSILLSIFDEFETLRSIKIEFSLGMIGILSLISIYFCTNQGITYFSSLSLDSLFTETALNLLLIMIVVWIYGRERFQRDIEFMLSQKYATWKVIMLRVVAPICLVLTLIISLFIAYYEHLYSSAVVQILGLLLIALPWISIPGYAVFIVLQTSGSIGMRFKRCCKPTDWYPVEKEDRQNYEEAMGNMDITHQLDEVVEEVF